MIGIIFIYSVTRLIFRWWVGQTIYYAHNFLARIHQYEESIHEFSLVSRPSGVTVINPDSLGMRLTRIVRTAKSAISHIYCCISSFSRCHVTLIWPELTSPVISKRFKVFVFKWRWLASAEQTWLTQHTDGWLYNSNTDSLCRFWRLTRNWLLDELIGTCCLCPESLWWPGRLAWECPHLNRCMPASLCMHILIYFSKLNILG